MPGEWLFYNNAFDLFYFLPSLSSKLFGTHSMISIIIPTYNEEAHIKATLKRLWEYDEHGLIQEIIIADGGSTDGTVEAAAIEGVEIAVSPKKGRAAQMNYGAALAQGPVLYFLHADTVPPQNFTEDINTALHNGYEAGCFRLAFDYDHWFLKANCWFTRFDVNAVRFGDQSLFVTKKQFEKAGGFCEQHLVLEDQEIIKRLKNQCHFKVLNKAVLTSARKYRENGIYKTQGIFFVIYFMFRFGYSQQTLVNTYRKLIRQDKL